MTRIAVTSHYLQIFVWQDLLYTVEFVIMRGDDVMTVVRAVTAVLHQLFDYVGRMFASAYINADLVVGLI